MGGKGMLKEGMLAAGEEWNDSQHTAMCALIVGDGQGILGYRPLAGQS